MAIIIDQYPSGDPLNAPISCNILPVEPGDLVYYSLVGPPDINPGNLVVNPIVVGLITDPRGLEYNIWAIAQGPGKEPSEVVQWTLVTEISTCTSYSNTVYLDSWTTTQSWINPDNVPVGTMDVYVTNPLGYGDFLGGNLEVLIDGIEIFNDCVNEGQFQLSIPANAKDVAITLSNIGCFNPAGYAPPAIEIVYNAFCEGAQ